MDKPIIQIEHLGKRYRIGAEREQYLSLRDQIAGIFSRNGYRSHDDRTDFWALRNVSFNVEPGETVGIIGRNGAGKSTLLKVLSQITPPTEGKITMRGRVASLLEVGTGFHPELTGRENIYLNGAILGMTRSQVRAKFAEIVAFAEVEKFLDTPVKRYSSGMYVRLAFAVAAHLEPEILVVDEVLAVGDAEFQKKCLDKMEDVSRRGRTVFFVSHNMSAVSRLCHRALLIEAGSVFFDGPATETVTRYLTSTEGTSARRSWPDLDAAPGSDVIRLRSLSATDGAGTVQDVVPIEAGVRIQVEYRILTPGVVIDLSFSLTNGEGVSVLGSFDRDLEWHRQPRPAGDYITSATIPGDLLQEGTFFVSVAVHSYKPQTVHLWERDSIAFNVVDTLAGASARGDYVGALPWAVRPRLHWETEYSPGAATLGNAAFDQNL